MLRRGGFSFCGEYSDQVGGIEATDFCGNLGDRESCFGQHGFCLLHSVLGLEFAGACACDSLELDRICGARHSGDGGKLLDGNVSGTVFIYIRNAALEGFVLRVCRGFLPFIICGAESDDEGKCLAVGQYCTLRSRFRCMQRKAIQGGG